jgi:hypothetical protein
MSEGMSTSNHGVAKSARSHLEAVLDEALRQTFPASDPFHVARFTATEPPLRPVDRRAPRLETSAIAGRRPGRRRRRAGR